MMELNYWPIDNKYDFKNSCLIRTHVQSFNSQNKSEEDFSLDIFAVFSVSSNSKFRCALFNIRYN